MNNFDFRCEVNERIHELNCAITEIRNFLVTAPAGRIEVSARKKNFYYRYIGCEAPTSFAVGGGASGSDGGATANDKGRCYLSPTIPEQKQTLENVLNKSYFKKLLPILESELRALLVFRDSYKPDKKYMLFEDLHPGKKAHTKKMFYTFEEREEQMRKNKEGAIKRFCEAWHSRIKEYQNPYKFEDVAIETNDGHMVRSKSERTIADELAKCGFEYKYESSFHTSLGVFYPDFRFIDKRTGREYIWEHFGMLDNSRYLNRECLAKLDGYAAEGYILGQNLLATFETSDRPLQLSQVQRTIEIIKKHATGVSTI